MSSNNNAALEKMKPVTLLEEKILLQVGTFLQNVWRLQWQSKWYLPMPQNPNISVYSKKRWQCWYRVVTLFYWIKNFSHYNKLSLIDLNHCKYFSLLEKNQVDRVRIGE